MTDKENQPPMDDKQKAAVDKALGKTELSASIGGASEGGGDPKPNDPTPLDKAKEIGQDLHKQGVTMDKE